MVVRAARGEPETRTGRADRERSRKGWPLASPPGRRRPGKQLFPAACAPPAQHGEPEGSRGAPRLTRQRSGRGARGVLVHRHRAAAAATGEELPRRGELGGHRNGECGSAHGSQGVRTPARPGPTFLSSFPGLLKGRPRSSSILLGQMLSKARRPAAAPSQACILRPRRRRPWPRSPRRLPTPGAPLGACGLRSCLEVREGAWPGGAEGRLWRCRGRADRRGRTAPSDGRGSSRRSARGGAFGPGQSARGRRR